MDNRRLTPASSRHPSTMAAAMAHEIPQSSNGMGDTDRVGLSKLLPHLSRHTPFQVDQAPSAVGLYAWYGVFDAGPMDWKLDVDPSTSTDLGIERLMNATARHSARFYPPPLEVNVSGRLVQEWKGELHSISAQVMKEKLGRSSSAGGGEGDPSLDARGSAALGNTLAKPAMRGELVRLLSLSTPLFSAPLYIGVSDNLRRRLGEHTRDLEKFTAAVALDPDVQVRLRQADKNFACRAVGAGFSPDSLEVWALNLETLGQAVSATDARVLIEAVEWLLNRWHKPQLGKR